MTTDRALAITHIRRPLNPRTWSGTTRNVADALALAGVRLEGIHSGVQDTLRVVTYAALSVLQGRGPVYSAFNGHSIANIPYQSVFPS